MGKRYISLDLYLVCTEIFAKREYVSFPHEAIRGLGFFSAQVDAFPHHEWPKATSDEEMHQRVLRKSLTRELPHVEKAFSN